MSIIARMTLEEYEKMPPLEIVNGVEPRTELIRGELRIMTPIGTQHADIVDCLERWSHATLPMDRVRVRVQQPLRIAALESEPLPDVVWVVERRYRVSHPGPEDVFLIIEVADSSLTKDRGEKAELYAGAGIEEYWIANIQEQCVEVLRNPLAGTYRDRQVFLVGQEVRSLKVAEAVLPVALLFGDDGE